MKRRVMNRSLTVGTLALMAGSAAWAQTNYEASVGVGHSDNITRVETGKQEETVAQAGLRFSIDREGPRLRADFVGDLSYQHYLDDTFDSELLGNLGGTLRYAFVEDRFDWVVEEHFGQVLFDPLEPATPENRENINYLTTGPEFTFPIGTQTRVRVGARYAITTYEDSPFDSDAVQGEIALVRLLSTSSSIAVHARRQDVTYDEAALGADYTQDDFFVRYGANGLRTRLAVDAGFSRLDREGLDEEGSPLVRLSVQRHLSSSMSATLALSREFANSGTAIATHQQVGVGLGTAPGRQTVEPFTQDRIALTWAYARNRTEIGLTASFDDREYETTSDLDQTLATYSLRARRELTPRLSAEIAGSFARGEFALPGQEYTDFGAFIALNRRVSRSSSISLRYDFVDRDSEMPGLGYRENTVWLSFVYGNGRPRERLLDTLPPEITNH